MKSIKRYKDRHLPTPTAYLMSLMAIFSIASCQKNCNHNRAHELASMTMEIDKCTLKDSETTIRIHIKNDGETIAHLDDFRLKANIAKTGGVGSMLAYRDADDNRKSEAEIDELLTHFFEHESLDPEGSLTIELQVQPGASVSHAVINLELYDTNEEKIVATETVTWSVASYELSFIGIPDPAELEDDEELRLQILNKRDEKVNTDDIIVCLTSTNGVEFALNGQEGDSIEASLTEILGSTPSILARDDTTSEITLKLADAHGDNYSEITLELKEGGTSLAQETVTWLATSHELSFIGIPYPAELKDDEAFRLQIFNEGDEEVNTDDITVYLTSTNGVEFALNGQEGVSIEASLTEILGSTPSILARHNTTSGITLKLADAHGKDSSEITLELKKGGTSLAQETVTWSAASYELSFIGIPDPAELKNDEALLFQIFNKGDKEVNTDDITVYLTSTHGVEFNLNGQEGVSIEASLTEILGGTSTSIPDRYDATSEITLKLADAHGKDSSEITLELKEGGTSLAQETMTWSAASYKMSFIGIPDPAKLKNDEALLFQIFNKGYEEVNTDDITVCLTSTHGVEFALNGIEGAIIEASLTKILGASTSILASSITSEITLKLADAHGKDSSEITLELKKGGTSLTQETVTWAAASYKMSSRGISEATIMHCWSGTPSSGTPSRANSAMSSPRKS